MTNAQPEDINARFDNIDEQLEQIGDEIDLIRTIQNANRREVRANSQTIACLERVTDQLAAIARDHQIAMCIASQEAARDREQATRDREQAVQQRQQDLQQVAQDRQQAAIDRQEFRNEIQRIWEYLRNRNGGSYPSS